jgi:hypothetical protein
MGARGRTSYFGIQQGKTMDLSYFGIQQGSLVQTFARMGQQAIAPTASVGSFADWLLGSQKDRQGSAKSF